MTTNLDQIKKTLEEILGHLNVNPKIEISQQDSEMVDVVIEGNDLSFLIGYRGESLDALQTLLTLINYKQTNEWIRIIVDINGYRKQKQDKIEQIARSYIDKVRFLGKEVEMNPMSAAERRYVHEFVSSYDDVTSESTGEGQSRRVVIKPKA